MVGGGGGSRRLGEDNKGPLFSGPTDPSLAENGGVPFEVSIGSILRQLPGLIPSGEGGDSDLAVLKG